MVTDKTTDENPATDEILEDDPIVTYILTAVEGGGLVSPNHIAQKIARDRGKASDPKDTWRKYMTAVRQQAISLARKGRLNIIRKGEVADPNDFKGLYKLRLPIK